MRKVLSLSVLFKSAAAEKSFASRGCSTKAPEMYHIKTSRKKTPLNTIMTPAEDGGQVPSRIGFLQVGHGGVMSA